MPDQGTIFNEQTPAQEPTAGVQQTDPNAPFANMLTGIQTEDGRQKYSDVSSALASVPHAQKHIAGLETELTELKEELLKRKTAEQTLLDFKENHATEPTSSEEVDYSKIAELVQQTITDTKTNDTRSKNLGDVVQTFKTAYSDKAEEMFYQKANEVGMSVQQINELAAQSPAAALKLLGETPSQPLGSMRSSVNTETLPDVQEEFSAKIPRYANTKDLTNAWKNAGKQVQLKRET